MPLTHLAKPLSCSSLCAFNTRLDIIGESVNAAIPEINTAPASVSANSLNSEPVTPSINAIGEYTATKVMVIEITGIAISRVPIIAASNGDFPSFTWRSTFSSTTIASSTTKPIAKIKANSVSKLIEKPNICKKNNTPINEIGIVTTGTIIARNEPKKRIITTNTITVASIIVL